MLARHGERKIRNNAGVGARTRRSQAARAFKVKVKGEIEIAIGEEWARPPQ